MDKHSWKNRNQKIYKFFLQNVDRPYVVNELFPKIGKYLKDNKKNKVLNIGIETFNIYDKEFFLNENMYFCGLDKDKKIIPNNWSNFFHQNLIEEIKIDMPKFDVIIDYGVIGWPNINSRLTINEMTKYIANIHFLLENDGLYFLKVDYGSPLYKKHNLELMNIVNNFFTITKFHNLEKKTLIQNNNCYFETFVFRKS